MSTPEEQTLNAAWAAAELEFASALGAFNEANEKRPLPNDWELHRIRLDAAMRNMRELRRFWRSVGESLPPEHPGSRHFIRVEN